MKINLNQLTLTDTLSLEVSSALRQVEFKKNKRQKLGFIDTVATQLHMHHKWKEVRHRVAVLSRTEPCFASLREAMSLELSAQDVGDWKTRNEARHLKNIIIKAIAKEAAHA